MSWEPSNRKLLFPTPLYCSVSHYHPQLSLSLSLSLSEILTLIRGTSGQCLGTFKSKIIVYNPPLL
jgi:hypothetical protein